MRSSYRAKISKNGAIPKSEILQVFTLFSFFLIPFHIHRGKGLRQGWRIFSANGIYCPWKYTYLLRHFQSGTTLVLYWNLFPLKHLVWKRIFQPLLFLLVSIWFSGKNVSDLQQWHSRLKLSPVRWARYYFNSMCICVQVWTSRLTLIKNLPFGIHNISKCVHMCSVFIKHNS